MYMDYPFLFSSSCCWVFSLLGPCFIVYFLCRGGEGGKDLVDIRFRKPNELMVVQDYVIIRRLEQTHTHLEH